MLTLASFLAVVGISGKELCYVFLRHPLYHVEGEEGRPFGSRRCESAVRVDCLHVISGISYNRLDAPGVRSSKKGDGWS
jgi:hypothetical protein